MAETLNMLDINYIRENLDKVKKSIKDRKSDVDLDQLLKLDERRRDLISKVDELRAKRNEAAKVRDKNQGARVKDELQSLEKQLNETEKKWQELMYQVPNILMEEVPVGDATKNKIIRKNGELPKFSFSPKDHIELGRNLDIIDFERGVKVAGYRGYFLKNEGARLHWAILNFALDYISQKGFKIVVPPVIDRGFALLGGGQFPWGEEDTYKVGDDKYLVGTAEIPLMALHSDETINAADLPKRYIALSPCFRTEIGSYGKDTKGLYRVHEFYKVEQVVLCEADEKEALGYFENLLDNAEGILQELSLPYQVVCLSSEDMGKKAAITYDIETWMSSRESYGETHSNSYVTDFQTRRLKIRYRNKDGNTKFCHALNNTAVASPRILIALLENNQRDDGSIKIPEVLQKYTGFSEIKPK
ncbi:MAG: serine--tRNA ligase [Candidatus Daviesbacteria bacterium]|nr:serine--tRNA ligase [Candidatus Daviesbacteria bacterium]